MTQTSQLEKQAWVQVCLRRLEETKVRVVGVPKLAWRETVRMGSGRLVG